jgi:hypothetical protein
LCFDYLFIYLLTDILFIYLFVSLCLNLFFRFGLSCGGGGGGFYSNGGTASVNFFSGGKGFRQGGAGAVAPSPRLSITTSFSLLFFYIRISFFFLH